MSTINTTDPDVNLVRRAMPDILLQYPEELPAPLRDSLFEDIGDIADIVVVEEEPPRLWASLKIVMIGLVAAFIAKPYLEGFANEAGKDHYRALKKWLPSLARAAKRITSRTVTATDSTEKLDPNDSTSGSLSVFFMTKLGISVKLVYNDKMSAEQWGDLTAQFVDMVKDHYQNHPEDQLTKSLHALTDNRYPTAYVVMDEKTGGWVIGTWRDFSKSHSITGNDATDPT